MPTLANDYIVWAVHASVVLSVDIVVDTVYAIARKDSSPI